ncbi:MAG: hypothetical protein KatS3mg115_1304 [Candidatus Poribacteria bacterium]|nr:MAG: hypothetical protein KatS3mg115_1304 [Candidatus Poribacteria bacterium]
MYFEESLSREPETREKALAWLVVALDRSLQKVANIPEKRQEYESQLNRWLEEVRANPKAMAFLVDILDEHSVNSQSAARLLARLGPDASKALLNAYRTKPEEQAVILDIFRQIGPSILPALQEAVRSNDDLTNREKMLLVRLIGEVGGESAVAFLREIRKQPSDRRRGPP